MGARAQTAGVPSMSRAGKRTEKIHAKRSGAITTALAEAKQQPAGDQLRAAQAAVDQLLHDNSSAVRRIAVLESQLASTFAPADGEGADGEDREVLRAHEHEGVAVALVSAEFGRVGADAVRDDEDRE